jgi:hypothetical protein
MKIPDPAKKIRISYCTKEQLLSSMPLTLSPVALYILAVQHGRIKPVALEVNTGQLGHV